MQSTGGKLVLITVGVVMIAAYGTYSFALTRYSRM
jgi:hypothetical protein